MSEPPEAENMPTRKCRVCGATYPATTEYFVGNKGSLYGVDRICWECKRKAHRKYREENREALRERGRTYREENRELLREKTRQRVSENFDEVHEYRKQYHEKNKEKLNEWNRNYYYENREKEIERMRVYREKNREAKRALDLRRYYEQSEEARDQKLAAKREWNTKNRDKIRLQNQKWRLENPYKHAVNKQLRKARERGLPNTLTIAEWQAALDYFGGRCAYCGSEGELSQDHYVPLSDPDCPGTVVQNILPACRGCNSSKKNLPPAQWLRRKFDEQAKEIEQRIKAYFEQIRKEQTIK